MKRINRVQTREKRGPDDPLESSDRKRARAELHGKAAEESDSNDEAGRAKETPTRKRVNKQRKDNLKISQLDSKHATENSVSTRYGDSTVNSVDELQHVDSQPTISEDANLGTQFVSKSQVVAISDEAGSGKTRGTGIIIIDDDDDDQQIVEEEGGDEGDSVGDGGEEYDDPQADGAEDAGNDIEHIANVPNTPVTYNHKSKSSASLSCSC